jgi:hypothetical protein
VVLELLEPFVPPTEQEARFYGMTIEQATPPPTELWPDNVDALKAFTAMNTRWDVGMSGATGLIYAELPFVFEMAGLPREDWPTVFDDVQVMERTELAYWKQKRDQQEQEQKNK